MSIKKADGKGKETKPPRESIFSRQSAASKERAAEVFQSHAPQRDADGNFQNFQKPKIAPPTEKQRDQALLIWSE
ncbi:hypothetical protein CIB48_g5722 [Xylaria polymorpha]|nr:hypothetical protein CIB48_g5722 [Xylaria polymorpha]